MNVLRIVPATLVAVALLAPAALAMPQADPPVGERAARDAAAEAQRARAVEQRDDVDAREPEVADEGDDAWLEEEEEEEALEEGVPL
jgi:hypothetical protein